MTIEAVFWDYDNTILETAEAHWNKHKICLARHGIELAEQYRQRIYHNNGNQNYDWMNTELGLIIPREQYLSEIDTEFQKHMIAYPMREGIEDAFDYLADKKIPQCIVTNARTASAKPVLEAKNITGRMVFTLYKEDYEGRKPDPLPYLTAIKKMEEHIGKSLTPRNCLAIEDDPKGVESAHRAGLTVIHRKLSKDQDPCEYANHVCHSTDDFLKLIKE